MKAKNYIGILSILLLSTSTIKAQRDDSGYNRNDDARLVVNNYYDNNDYNYTSRINRFHRSYAAFDYYSPVFTDSYLYNYRPFSLGLGLFGGLRFGLGFSFNYPDYDYGYDSGYGDYYGYDPYYGNNYWGYNPFYYSGWYSPFIFSFNFGNRWRNNYYGWNGYNHYHDRYDYRPDNYRYQDSHGYYSNRYSSSSTSRRNPGNNSGRSTYNNGVSRRGISSGSYSRNEVSNNRPVVRSENVVNTAQTRRTVSPAVNRGEGRDIRYSGNSTNYRSNTNIAYSTHNSRNIYASMNNGRSSNNLNQRVNNSRNFRSNSGITSNSSRTMSAPVARSFSSGSRNSGSVARSSSSHSGSRSSGSKSSSSRGRSSGRR
jgi:hypothetical protein